MNSRAHARYTLDIRLLALIVLLLGAAVMIRPVSAANGCPPAMDAVVHTNVECEAQSSSIREEPEHLPAGVENWASDQIDRFRAWQDRGIVFEGAGWDAGAVRIALNGLDAMLARFGGDWDRLRPLLGLEARESLVYDDDTSLCPNGLNANCAFPWTGRIAFNVATLTLEEFLHEHGHLIDWFLQQKRAASDRWWSATGLVGLGWEAQWIEVDSALQRAVVYDDAYSDAPYSTADIREDFADTFVAWVLEADAPARYRPLNDRRRGALLTAFQLAK